MTAKITVIGGGLAGTEAAWQIARRGLRVRFYEMRPVTKTAAHQTDWLGELVCSNSLKSDLPGTAPFLPVDVPRMSSFGPKTNGLRGRVVHAGRPWYDPDTNPPRRRQRFIGSVDSVVPVVD